MLDRKTAIPLYFQIKEDIKTKIENGDLKNGELLHTEKWYEEYYRVSRVTVRKALDALIADGYASKYRNTGIVVKKDVISREISSLKSVQEYMLESGRNYREEVTYLELSDFPNKLQSLFKASKEEKCWVIKSTHYVDDLPLAVLTTFLRQMYCPYLTKEMYVEHHHYRLVEQFYGKSVEKSFQEVSALSSNSISESTREALEIKSAPAILLRVVADSYLDENSLYEHTEMYYLADRYKLQFTLYR